MGNIRELGALGVCGYSDSEERNQALPGIGVLLGSWFAGAGQEWEELGTLVKENTLGSLEPRAWHMYRKGNKLLSPFSKSRCISWRLVTGCAGLKL